MFLKQLNFVFVYFIRWNWWIYMCFKGLQSNKDPHACYFENKPEFIVEERVVRSSDEWKVENLSLGRTIKIKWLILFILVTCACQLGCGVCAITACFPKVVFVDKTFISTEPVFWHNSKQYYKRSGFTSVWQAWRCFIIRCYILFILALIFTLKILKTSWNFKCCFTILQPVFSLRWLDWIWTHVSCFKPLHSLIQNNFFLNSLACFPPVLEQWWCFTQ